VFVTGDAQVSSTVPSEFATVAYDAATGAQRWVRQYRTNGAFAGGTSLAVSPDGSKVVATGDAGLSNGTTVYQTIAYGTAAGTPLWTARYASSGGEARTSQVAVSPDASRVFVTGWSVNGIGHQFYTTVAYDAATGDQAWAGQYSGIFAYQLAVSPDGSKVFVTGNTPGGKPTQTDYGTVAYNAATGAQLWAKHYGTGGADTARAVAASAAGVFVTGYTGYTCNHSSDTCYHYETVAYQP
jgi:WD40 repeat protein